MVEKQKVVIVGAGMAGLTAAAYLTRENYDVLLLDKNDRCGGLVNTFETNGFSFDTGPRAFVNSGMVKPILKDLGIDWNYLENKISIGIEDGLFTVETMDSVQEYKRILCDLYPESIEDIEKITQMIVKLSEYTRILYEFDNPNFVDFKSDHKFIFKQLIPWTFKFLNALRKMNQFETPMEEFLAEYSDNQSLIDILTQFFFRRTPTHFALGYFYVYLDYFYPEGGTGMLAKLLEKKILDSGGEIKLNHQIIEINPAESTVVDTEFNSYSFDHLIWAADLKQLYRSLNHTGLSATDTEQIETETRQILSSKGAESVFILFAAVDRPPEYFQARGGPHQFYTPSREGLGTLLIEERQNLVDNFEEKTRDEILDWTDSFIRYNTFEISMPALRDASLAPEGQTGVMVSFLFDHSLVEKIEEAGWYNEFKEFIEDRTISVLSESHFEGFENDLLFKFSSTPLTINKIAGSSEGGIIGWSFETDIPVVHRLKDIPKSSRTAIPGVYKAGQWAYSPAGVPIAMLTGWYASQDIIKGSKKK